MSLRVTILGCGSSGGVPRIGPDWGGCDPLNPRNRRRRCSIMLDRETASGTTRVVIDTSPDFREQMLSAGAGEISGVWFTHEHADHTHGVDDLRAYFLRQRGRIPVWADEQTYSMLSRRFAYCFETQPGSDYPPILDHRLIRDERPVMTDGAGGEISGIPFRVHHGSIDALGFRIGGLAYTPDVNGIPQDSIRYLENLDIWIVDALRPKAHPTHFSLPETLQWIERMKPRRAILTNMHVDLDYEALKRQLPPGVEPAYDGMTVEA
ncbi:MAG: MBL fold metallo-hydrolase [Proteobacteria bacterium]|nr:MBL fold metallo-hydrolase [Pseudomonadota bacterium]